MRAALCKLCETNFEAFRTELLRNHVMQDDTRWADDRGNLRQCVFIVDNVRFSYTMLNGEVIETEWRML